MLDALRNHDDPGLHPAPLRHPERLAGSIDATRRRRITAARLFEVVIEIAAGLVLLIAVLAALS